MKKQYVIFKVLTNLVQNYNMGLNLIANISKKKERSSALSYIKAKKCVLKFLQLKAVGLLMLIWKVTLEELHNYHLFKRHITYTAGLTFRP